MSKLLLSSIVPNSAYVLSGLEIVYLLVSTVGITLVGVNVAFNIGTLSFGNTHPWLVIAWENAYVGMSWYSLL